MNNTFKFNNGNKILRDAYGKTIAIGDKNMVYVSGSVT
jgi:hypothetical protein